MGKLSTALVTGTPTEIEAAIVWDIVDNSHDKAEEWKDVMHDQDATKHFMDIAANWLKHIAYIYQHKEFNEKTSYISKKMYKDAVKATNNPVMKMYFGAKASVFTPTAKEVVELLANQSGEVQKLWGNYAYNGLIAIGRSYKPF